MPFIHGKTIHGLGEYSALTSMERSSQGILGKREFYRDEKRYWSRGGEFPHKLAGLIFWEEES